ncbi:MAG: PHP domain-containing protein [Chloroflexi bacterium]|nr:PHP domain-containing protein [Chloroflexota bacterium]
MHILTRSIWIILLLALRLPHAAADEPLRLLDPKLHHLRSGSQAEWQEFADKTPEGLRLEITFAAQVNERESTLFIRQDDVKLDWRVQLNGRNLGTLFLMEAPLVQALAVPPQTLREGNNRLAILPPGANDDILVGDVKLDPRPLQEALNQAHIDVEVSDLENGKAVPSRVTIVDELGALAAIHTRADQSAARRPGVVYTGNGKASIGLLPGSFTIYASRGFEYSVATQKVSVAAGQTQTARLRIRREFPTPGMISCDTHVHTFTHSRHGDATIEERMLTVAGEGIELPIATDHDYLADYSEPSVRMNVAGHFTPVVGCEVTTAKGHFNVFPMLLGSRVPDFRITDWPGLMQSMHATPGARVVILNHPRNIHSNFQPFAATNFNAITGENRRGFDFSFDAIEVINSSALQSDLTLGWRDWFALLNYGYRVTAVGSSDCHDVSRYIIGQGRSYVACNDSDPAKINVEEVCQSFLKGRVLVSLGLLVQMTVNGRFGVADLATGLGDKFRVEATVLGPAWTSAERVELFANGVKIREQQIPSAREAKGVVRAAHEKTRIIWEIDRPAHDAYLVAIASGPAVTAPYWAIARPYQPSSPVWKPRVLGLTNPIWIDADGDGKFTPARDYAKALLQRTGVDPAQLLPALASFDEAVAAQSASLCQAGGRDIRSPEFNRLLGTASPAVQQGFAAFAGTLQPK